MENNKFMPMLAGGLLLLLVLWMSLFRVDQRQYALVKEFQHYQVALLSAEFLNPATRDKKLEPIFLLKISRQKRETTSDEL